MDVDNLNNSFEGLFANNGGWIITKNEKGNLKVANCKEDESKEFEKTRDWIAVSVDNTKTDTFKPPEYQLYKHARFFIRDLLNSDKKGTYFICRNLPFTHVYISGMIVSVFDRNDKYWISVDDGTSKILCLIQKQVLNSVRPKYNSRDRRLRELFSSDKNNIFLQASNILQATRKRFENSVPTYDQFESGITVKIIGKLSQYNDNRYIFINKICAVPKEANFHTVYLKEMIDLYTNYYKD